jgi:phosphoribosylaminoimidazole-succinocarboxamide synthase
MTDALFESSIQSLPLLGRGKVRDIYAIDDDTLLIVTTDRLSAFDVILPDPIPDKGKVLTAVADFWFGKLSPHRAQPTHRHRRRSRCRLRSATRWPGRAMVVKRLKALPVEAVVRGYLIGSGWKDYQKTGKVCGIPLPPGLKTGAQVARAAVHALHQGRVGAHDENIDFAGPTVPGPARHRKSRPVGARTRPSRSTRRPRLRRHPRHHHRRHQVRVRLDAAGTLHLIDEVLTPDSSRFWPADQYQEGISPPSYDKQYVRDYLTASGWNKQSPGPELPPEVVARTAEKYQEALRRLVA